MNHIPSIFFLKVILVTLLLSASCGGKKERNHSIDISGIEIDPVSIARYEQALFAINPNAMRDGLKRIATEFPVFLGVDLDDSLNIFQLHQFVTDPVNRSLFEMVSETYPDLTRFEEEFYTAFKHFRFHFPSLELPSIASYVSGLIYEMPVQFFDNKMIVALDMYLGEGVEHYRRFGIPLYRIQRMTDEHLVRDGMYELYYYHFLERPGNNVLERMISKGKHLYFLDAMLPGTPDHIKIGFPEDKLRWCFANESNVWAFMVQNELLYASDVVTMRRFFTDGPFTSQFSAESPARIGEWVGWQIVRSYMNNNRNVTLSELIMEEDFRMIFDKSRYRPSR